MTRSLLILLGVVALSATANAAQKYDAEMSENMNQAEIENQNKASASASVSASNEESAQPKQQMAHAEKKGDNKAGATKKDDKAVKNSVKKALKKSHGAAAAKFHGKVIDTMKTMARRSILRRLILRAEKITGKKLSKKKRFALIMHIHKVLLAKRKAMRVRVAHNIKDIYVEAKVAMKDQEKNLRALAREKQAFMLKAFIASQTRKFNAHMKAWKKKNPMKGYHVYRAIVLAKLKDSFRKKKYSLKNWAANFVKAGHLKVKRNAIIAIKKDKNDIMNALRKYMYGLRQRLIDIKFGKFKRCSVKRARRIARGLERQIMAAVGKIIKPKNSSCRKAADIAATIVSKRLANNLREVIAAGVVDRMGNK